MSNTVNELSYVFENLKHANLAYEASIVMSVILKLSDLSLDEYKKKIEKEMTTRWAEYQKLAHELRKIEKEIEERKNV